MPVVPGVRRCGGSPSERYCTDLTYHPLDFVPVDSKRPVIVVLGLRPRLSTGEPDVELVKGGAGHLRLFARGEQRELWGIPATVSGRECSAGAHPRSPCASAWRQHHSRLRARLILDRGGSLISRPQVSHTSPHSASVTVPINALGHSGIAQPWRASAGSPPTPAGCPKSGQAGVAVALDVAPDRGYVVP
jgi:hypothetical protein